MKLPASAAAGLPFQKHLFFSEDTYMHRLSMENRRNPAVLIKVFNSGYLIALLLFLAGSIGSLCDGVIASRGLGVAELAAIGIIYPYSKTMECLSLLFSSGSQVVIGRKIGQNQFEEVSKVFSTSFVFTGVLAIAIAVLTSLFANPVSRLFGASEAGGTLKPTMDYLISLAVGAPASGGSGTPPPSAITWRLLCCAPTFSTKSAAYSCRERWESAGRISSRP